MSAGVNGQTGAPFGLGRGIATALAAGVFPVASVHYLTAVCAETDAFVHLCQSLMRLELGVETSSALNGCEDGCSAYEKYKNHLTFSWKSFRFEPNRPYSSVDLSIDVFKGAYRYYACLKIRITDVFPHQLNVSH